MEQERIEELQEKFCFRVASIKGEKGLIPQLNVSKIKQSKKLFDEIKESKFEIIEYLENRDALREKEREEEEKQRTQDDKEKIEILKKSGELVYYYQTHQGDYNHAFFLGTGFHDKDFAEKRNYREEYRENMIFGNSATIKIEVDGFKIKDVVSEKDFDIGYEDHYYVISEKEFKRLLKLDQEKKAKEKAEKEARTKERKEAKEKKEKEVFAKAKETGIKQELDRFAVDCCNPNEECNTDIVVIYAMPDGTKKEESHHTY